jgi:aspartate kinase
MIIMKFGGTSLGTAESIQNVFGIVRGRLDQDPVPVVSAHAGVTNSLVDIAETAPGGDADVSKIVDFHHRLLEDLELPVDLLEEQLTEMADLVRGMKLVSEASPRVRDLLLSFGERCSARVLAAYFNKHGLPAQAVDAFEVGLRTDGNFGRARPVADDGRIADNMSRVEGIPIVTGFLGRDADGNITTLGRNGSDFSAALFGNALDAEEIQIWTDVDGVMTADPRLVESARPIPTMSFGEASELAYYGGKVLHPATILPAMEKSIPVRVLNTHNADNPGTVILPTYDESSAPVRAVVHKDDIHLINLVSPPMLQQHGFLAKVFGIAEAHEVDVDLVATSEVSITMTVDRADHLPPFCEELAHPWHSGAGAGHPR